jgi:hypothetical protein
MTERVVQVAGDPGAFPLARLPGDHRLLAVQLHVAGVHRGHQGAAAGHHPGHHGGQHREQQEDSGQERQGARVVRILPEQGRAEQAEQAHRERGHRAPPSGHPVPRADRQDEHGGAALPADRHPEHRGGGEGPRRVGQPQRHQDHGAEGDGHREHGGQLAVAHGRDGRERTEQHREPGLVREPGRAGAADGGPPAVTGG